jgi:hypothetical protein
MLVLLLLTAPFLIRLLVLPADGDGTKDLEILVLRHQLQVLRRKAGGPGRLNYVNEASNGCTLALARRSPLSA